MRCDLTAVAGKSLLYIAALDGAVATSGAVLRMGILGIVSIGRVVELMCCHLLRIRGSRDDTDLQNPPIRTTFEARIITLLLGLQVSETVTHVLKLRHGNQKGGISGFQFHNVSLLFHDGSKL